jgi:hypothetical protein
MFIHENLKLGKISIAFEAYPAFSSLNPGSA